MKHQCCYFCFKEKELSELELKEINIRTVAYDASGQLVNNITRSNSYFCKGSKCFEFAKYIES